VIKALAKEPEERFQKAMEMSTALDLAIAATVDKPVKEAVEERVGISEPETQSEAPEGEMLTEIAPPAPSDIERPDMELLDSDDTETSDLKETMTEEALLVEGDQTPQSAEAQPVESPEEVGDEVIIEQVVEPEEAAPEPVSEEVEGFPVAVPEEAPKPRKASRIKPVYIIVGIAAIAAIIGMVVIASLIGPVIGQVLNSDGCQTIEECQVKKNRYMEAEEWEAAVEKIDETLELIPDEHPPFAYLWCERGSAKAELEYIDEAISNFERCIEWTEGDPGLEHLRRGAEECIHHLFEVREMP